MPISRTWRRALPTIAALSLMMMCAGCGTSARVAAPPLDTRLPPRPAYMAEVPVAPQHKGQSAKHALAVREAELGEANSRLRRSGEFYDAVRAGAAAGGEGR